MANDIKIIYIEHIEVARRAVPLIFLKLSAEEEDSKDGQTKLGHRQLHSHTYIKK